MSYQGLPTLEILTEAKNYNRWIAENFLDITQPPPEHLVGSFQTIIGINVLEHVEDDERALFHVGTVLKPSGRLLVLVPAKKWAYTELDRQLGHFRRYELKELGEKLVKAAFQIEKLYFFNSVGLLSWIIRDKIQRSGGLRPYQISSF